MPGPRVHLTPVSARIGEPAPSSGRAGSAHHVPEAASARRRASVPDTRRVGRFSPPRRGERRGPAWIVERRPGCRRRRGAPGPLERFDRGSFGGSVGAVVSCRAGAIDGRGTGVTRSSRSGQEASERRAAGRHRGDGGPGAVLPVRWDRSGTGVSSVCRSRMAPIASIPTPADDQQRRLSRGADSGARDRHRRVRGQRRVTRLWSPAADDRCREAGSAEAALSRILRRARGGGAYPTIGPSSSGLPLRRPGIARRDAPARSRGCPPPGCSLGHAAIVISSSGDPQGFTATRASPARHRRPLDAGSAGAVGDRGRRRHRARAPHVQDDGGRTDRRCARRRWPPPQGCSPAVRVAPGSTSLNDAVGIGFAHHVDHGVTPVSRKADPLMKASCQMRLWQGRKATDSTSERAGEDAAKTGEHGRRSRDGAAWDTCCP